MAGADTTPTAGTGTIPEKSKTPQDIFMEQLLSSVVAPTMNSMLDVSATTTGTGTQGTTGTKAETETQSGTKTSSTSSAAQALINQQIATIQSQLGGGDEQYTQLLGNIMNQSAQAFNPTNATSRRSGAYNSTTLDMLSNDAKAKATAAGAGAVLEDKRAKLASLVSLIEQNAQLNKTEAVNSTGTNSGTSTSNVTESKSTNTEASKIGSGAADAAKVAGAALMAKTLLGTQQGKNLTSTGLNALNKLLKLTETSGAVPSAVATDFFGNLGGNVTLDSIDAVLSGAGGFWGTLGSNVTPDIMKGFYTDPFGATAASGLTPSTGQVLEGFYNNDLSWFTDAGASSAAPSAAVSTGGIGDLISANSSAFGAGGLTALMNASDGKWGWKDTGSTAGAALGSLFGPLGTAAGSFIGGAIGEPVGNIVEGVGGVIGKISDSIADLVDLDCFITTACMKAQGTLFDDNCHELTQLRFLRDNYIKFLPNGPVQLAAYKEFAPKYVELINKLEDSSKVWSDLYTRFIAPTAEFVDEGNNKNAYLTYLLMLQYIQELTSFGGA